MLILKGFVNPGRRICYSRAILCDPVMVAAPGGPAASKLIVNMGNNPE